MRYSIAACIHAARILLARNASCDTNNSSNNSNTNSSNSNNNNSKHSSNNNSNKRGRTARSSAQTLPFGRGDDTVGNPHRAQISQFELLELKIINSSFSSLSSH